MAAFAAHDVEADVLRGVLRAEPVGTLASAPRTGELPGDPMMGGIEANAVCGSLRAEPVGTRAPATSAGDLLGAPTVNGAEAEAAHAEPIGTLASAAGAGALLGAPTLSGVETDAMRGGLPAESLSALAPAASDPATGPAISIAANRAAADLVDPASLATALSSGPTGTGTLTLLLSTLLAALDDGRADRPGPLPPGGPAAVREAVAASAFGALPDRGADPFQTLAALGRLLAWGAADPAHPDCAAHLHCPPLAVSVAAETAVAALNQSLDSWDQSPVAGEIEAQVVRTLTRAVGYSDAATGVLTSGGTESNLMGLLLARDETLRRRFDADPELDGIPAVAVGRLRVLASDQAHFSIARNAAFLGLGERCVIPVASDAEGRMRPDTLTQALDAVADRDEIAIAVVGTAGTTDFGALDPLTPIAQRAKQHGAWFHVDAAYGGALILGTTPDERLTGLAAADSITLDLHKLGWQPVAAGGFLVKNAAALRTLEKRVAYLNSADDERAGYPSLLGRSLRTTRRADAVKIAAAFQALGRTGFQRLLDRCRELTRYAADQVKGRPELELTTEPQLTTVLFRYLPPDPRDADRVNGALRRHLLESGRAVLGRTELAHDRPGTAPGTVRLKLTLLNPHTTEPQIDALIAAICAAGGVASARSGPS
ncbi:MAG: pyridoxal phosphate-dependent decarboxylase family protein [Catenulispora sp.]